MIIQLTENDLKQMPPTLCTELLQWLQPEQARPAEPPDLQMDTSTTSTLDNPVLLHSEDHTHVRIPQLFDMGLLVESTQVRIRLKRDRAKQLGYSYVTTSIQISSCGTLVYEGEEFDKPSPLAKKVNGGDVNGWEYVEIKRDGQWICLDELRTIWRSALCRMSN